MPAARILIIGHQIPEPRATAAGMRMMQLLHCLHSAGYQLCFATASAQLEDVHHLEQIGAEVRQIALNDASFDQFLASYNPEIVLFDRFVTEEQYGWRVAKTCPGAVRILDTEDLHSLRKTREDLITSGRDFTPSIWKRDTTTFRELGSIYRCDLSLIISDYEMELLTEEAGISRELLLYLPFMFSGSLPGNSLPYAHREGFICIGNGRHKPNLDAFRWLKTAIWPEIRKALPEARVHLYGAYFPSAIQGMHNEKEGFLVKGYTPDASGVFGQSRVQLAPLRYGAGIKGKLFDSMQYGIPSVTTPIGAEGMHGQLPWNGVIAGDTEGFVKGAVTLYQQEGQWNQARENGWTLLRERYMANRHAPELLHKIAYVRDHLDQIRANNLVGGMLTHHRLASTKYLGKWIEAKSQLVRGKNKEL